MVLNSSENSHRCAPGANTPRGSSGDHGVMVIDTTFDFRTDAAGKDPDTYSATLCRYHQLLWSKPLPSGVPFELVPTSRPPYDFSHSSEAGDFVLSSDAFIPAYTRYGVPKPVLEQFSITGIRARRLHRQ